MKTKSEYLDILKQHTIELQTRFDIRSLRLFGSVARDEHKEGSDIDVCVEMPPNLFRVIGLKRFLEDLLGCPVDVIRMHSHMNSFLKKEIERDGICII